MNIEKFKDNFIRKEIESVILTEEEQEKYKLKKFGNKNNDERLYFSKKDFEDYREDNDVRVVGNIRIDQKKYIDPEHAKNIDEAYQKKHKKKVIGSVKVKLDDNYFAKHKSKFNDEPYRYFDLYESEDKGTVGYAWVGEHQYVRLTRKNNLIIIILFVIAALVIASCVFPGKVHDRVLDIIDGSSLTHDERKGSEAQSDNYSVYVWDVKTVSAENPTIPLRNYPDNDVYLSYEIQDADGNVLDTTGAFEPNKQVEYNFYQLFNGEAGTYDLKLKVCAYDMETKEDLCTSTMPVQVIVE